MLTATGSPLVSTRFDHRGLHSSLLVAAYPSSARFRGKTGTVVSMNLTSFFPPAPGLYRALFAASASLILTLTAATALAESKMFAVEVRGTGPAIILIPGLGCSGAVWKTTVDDLAVDHTCHVITLAGFAGEPPASPGPFLDTAEQAIKTYLESHHLEKPVIIGHSLGGLLTLRLAVHLQPAPAAGIIVDSLPFYAGMQPGATPETARQFAEMMRTQLAQQPREAFLQTSKQSAALLVSAEPDRDLVVEWMSKSDQPTVAQAMAEVVAFDGRALVSEIKCPVLVLEAGLAPGAVPEEVFDHQYAALREGKRIRFSDARHFVMLDQPRRFLQEIHTFLQANAR